MPLTKRAVSPVNVSRNTIPKGIDREELQCAANGTVANLIRQLSSLSKHAENIFGDIYHDAILIHHKTNTLQQRLDRLHSKVADLDANTDQASLNEANMRKAFKSSMLVDQHILDRGTFPTALAERYASCDPPPDLDALNPYRDSPTPALALYTNPSFFFDLWKKETLKEVADRPRRVKSPNDGSKSPKKRRKQPLQGHGPLGTTMYNDMQHRNRQISGSRLNQQNEVFSFPEEYQAPQALGLQLNFKNQHPANHNIVAPIGMTMHHNQQQNIHQNQQRGGPPSGAHNNRGSPIVKRPSEAPPSASSVNLDNLPPPDMSILAIDDEDDDYPPPPPPVMMHNSIVHQLPPDLPSTIQFVEPSAAPPTNIPPPPPPPPPMMMSSAAATFAAPASKPSADGEASSSTPPQPKQPDARSDLLAQIQSGIKLKKVQRAEAEAAERAALAKNDVAAILQRRMEQVMGNDDDSSSEEGVDDDEWD